MALPETHPVADIWPLMDEAALDKLAADISVRGQVLAIIRVNGLLLDGRNRWLACERIGIEPWVEDIDDTDDPDALAWSLNEHRRHADAGVRAMAAARRADMRQGQRTDLHSANLPNVSQDDAAQKFGVSPRSLRSAKTVLDHGDPVIVNAVTNGDLAVSLAEKAVRRLEETGQQFQNVGELKNFVRDIWREDHPAPPKPQVEKPTPVAEHSHASVDTFGVVRAVVRHAEEYPMADAVAKIDKWTRLNILDDLPPAIDYLTKLQTALSDKGE